MKRRAETLKIPETFMLELFLQRLPTSVQTILAAVTDLTLYKAAEISDRILEVTPVPMEIHAVDENNSNSMKEKLLCEIEKLNARIDKLEFSCSRSPSRRNRSNQRLRGNSQNRNSSVCCELAKTQQNDPETQKLLQDKSSSLQLALKPCLSTNSDLMCDISTGSSRPLVPESFRRIIFEQLHNISHPGIAATTKLISARYVWPNMKRNIKEWVRCYEPCQRSKVQHHTKAPLGTFSLPDARFQQIHIDIVGPLPPSDGCIYLLTLIDRFSKWPEAIPIADMQTKTICRAIFHTWISRFGCPSIITTDQGSQMRSSLYREFSEMLGTNRIRTTAYHPIANGIVESSIVI
ncbi:Retrovirus-related Pol polyprotein from transposon 412 [Araneus ventricosus]|uniref:RNA-directed DNA polymerase n=1 Tax=Araneus ventricosus TaxID=182803 RepID=A0A4Y2NGX7_ARAVE|nr:Retrovirus-related Pol polyprotein from transposon 412 [Araneus ventricosus]